MAFEVVPTTFGEDAIATAFAHIPHAFVDIAVAVDHPAFAMGQIVHPHAVVAVSRFVEHGASALFRVVFPVSSILSAEFVFVVCNPIGALSVAFVFVPSSLVLVSIGVVLYAEAFLFVVLPVSDVLMRAAPFVGLDGAVFVEGLFLDRRSSTFTQ